MISNYLPEASILHFLPPFCPDAQSHRARPAGPPCQRRLRPSLPLARRWTWIGRRGPSGRRSGRPRPRHLLDERWLGSPPRRPGTSRCSPCSRSTDNVPRTSHRARSHIRRGPCSVHRGPPRRRSRGIARMRSASRIPSFGRSTRGLRARSSARSHRREARTNLPSRTRSPRACRPGCTRRGQPRAICPSASDEPACRVSGKLRASSICAVAAQPGSAAVWHCDHARGIGR